MTKDFDPTKPVQTRGGEEAEIFATDMGGPDPIVGRVRDDDGKWYLRTWTVEGHFLFVVDEQHRHDLVNVPQETAVWANINKFSDGLSLGGIYDTPEKADRCHSEEDRVSRMKIVLKEGVWDD